FLGGLLSIIVALYSAYAGLTIGGVYWPVITTSLFSAAALAALGTRDHDKINIMQTAGSTGGLLAAGIIFTVPAAYMLGISLDFFQVTASALLGGAMGIALSAIIRKSMIEEENLPYADGVAAAKAIKTSTQGNGNEKRNLFAAFGIAGLYAIAKDKFNLVPQYFNLDTLGIGASNAFSFGSTLSLIPLAGGFLIGTLFTSAWFAGAVLSNLILVPYMVYSGIYASKAVALLEFAKPAGVAVVIGAGAAYFLILGAKYAKGFFGQGKAAGKTATGNARAGKISTFMKIGIVAAFAACLLLFDLDIGMSVIALAFAIGMAILGGRVTGEMNVDPMEIFAMVAIVLGKLILGITALKLVLLAAVVCTSAGIAGDMMQDYKVGHILGTKPMRQLV
ncbi:MAG TPA: OPT/YSL family transporter, partial [Candidatus Micrarchaeota archaeon]|nr:OPT/YSL family transporter [Candidatus Micrarchaeota archaeon]